MALPHLSLVLDRLGTLGRTPVREPQRSPALGLALVELGEPAGPRDGPAAAADGADSPLDALLADLRAYFRREYHGWTPVLGKNREVEMVGSTNVISGGGRGLPGTPTQAEVLTGGWSGRALPADADVLPEVEGSPGGRRTLHDGLARLDGDRGRGATVAVCDTRLWGDGALAGAYLAPPAALLPPPGPDGVAFTAGHALFVTGIVLRSAPGAAVVVHPTLDDHARGTTWQFANDLVALAGRGVDVINVSAGFFTGDDQPALAVTTALRLLGPRTVVVAAAGNHGENEQDGRRPMWPAAYDEVVAVGALTPQGMPATFSPDAPWVDLLAPGVNVVSNYFGDAVSVVDPDTPGTTGRYPGLAAWSGTSFAAAWVSGLVAARIRPGETDAPAALHRLLQDTAAGTTATMIPKWSA
ncbi:MULTISPECIES: S8/S53 family peptidase [unclassified Actinoplanes]|uniref:S8 family peptidase n=1 Tax=unclassified Actinoplanes TaxID=2626549 RepID=UPI0012BA690A|nr:MULTISPECIES: S8/S53 family peptidase [unclassified Actinoplanes]